MARLNFQLENTDSAARAGIIQFEAGAKVETPVFMPVGTKSSVKAITQDELTTIGYRLILSNTYHLYLRPGDDTIASFGSLKSFISWPHHMLTDSGGFQAYSLSALSKYNHDGVEFKSHIDGSKHLFTPKKVIDIQRNFRSDIVMPIDDCPALPATEKRLDESLQRTHLWIKQSKEYFYNQEYNIDQNLFGIVQGGTDQKRRVESAQFQSSLELPGYALGGLSVGEKKEDYRNTLTITCPILPKDKPRYLMGVGSIPEIIYAVESGIDMFDCVLPTRNARNGQVFTSKGKINLRNEKYKLSQEPIDSACSCPVCQKYSLGYIRHLHKSNEILAYNLSTHHNLYFMFYFMKDMRTAIIENRFKQFKNHWLGLNW